MGEEETKQDKIWRQTPQDYLLQPEERQYPMLLEACMAVR